MSLPDNYSTLQPDALPFVKAAFNRAATEYSEHAGVLDILSDRLLERLDPLAIQPAVVLDLGCGPGVRLAALRQRFRGARIYGFDVSANMLRQARLKASRWRAPSLAVADAAHLPMPDNSVDLILASQLIPWCHKPSLVLAELYRVLAPGGTVFWTGAGPDTLLEYRALWRHIDTYEHTFGLVDMHDLGDDMLAAGFDAPVLDRENLTISYASVEALVAELRGIGASNIAMGRRRGLMASSIPRRVSQASHQIAGQLPGEKSKTAGATQSAVASAEVEQKNRSSETGISVTLELVQGHGWKSKGVNKLAKNKPGVAGEVSISLEFLRSKLKRH